MSRYPAPGDADPIEDRLYLTLCAVAAVLTLLAAWLYGLNA